MKLNEKIVAALIVAMGLMGMGGALRSGIIQYKNMDRSVTVKGLSEREVMANKVTWSLTYKELGNNPMDMYDLLEEATKNARATAQKFADDSGSELGEIRSAQQGQFSIEDRDAHTPYIKNLRVVNTIEYSLK